MKKTVAVIGQGFVGGSLTTALSERGLDVVVYDRSGKIAEGGREANAPGTTALVRFAEIQDGWTGVVFVCLPTPMNEDGSCNVSIVEGVLDELAKTNVSLVAVVKSTVSPGTTAGWNKKYEETPLRVVFNPEFLREATALDDMRNQDRIVLGGPRPYINKAKQIFQKLYPNVPVIKTNSTTAEMVKYFTNIHLATRVVLSCEFAQVCEALDKQGLDIDYDKVKEYACYDKRLGGSHMSVPGPDGIAGSRGHCFPKDLAAIVHLSEKLGVSPNLMRAVQEKNLSIVPPEHRDWEKMEGRAVTKKQ